jgi:ferrochelatase
MVFAAQEILNGYDTMKPTAPYQHGSLARSGILLVNLGTPDAPTRSAVKRYLAQFLSDRRVVEIPRFIWWLLLHGLILPLRSGKSAAKYASIWTPEGSPLKVWTEKQAKLLPGFLAQRGYDVEVVYAMRYGQPSVETALLELERRGCDRVLVLPLYPQYSAATTASVFDAVFDAAKTMRNVPELRFVKHYHDQSRFIGALAKSLLAHWEKNGRGEKLVMSFHGMPRRTLELGDPYHCECYKTARLLAERLRLPKEEVIVSFQSRFGKAEWLKPYTAPTLQQLAKQGVKRVDVICPGFTSDCLETLEEIAMEAKQDFLQAGGEAFYYIPCLNDSSDWIESLADSCELHGVGWLRRIEDKPGAIAEAQASRARAQALGAGNLV